MKVATLNLFNRMGEWGHRAPLVIDQLEELAPDVIGLQEVDMVLDQGMWISRQINARLQSQPHYRIKHAVNPDQRASFHGIATHVAHRLRLARDPGPDDVRAHRAADGVPVRRQARSTS